MNMDLYQRRISYAVGVSLFLHLFLLWFYAATPLTRALAQFLSRPVAVRQVAKDPLKRTAQRRPPPQLSFIEVDSTQATAVRPDTPRFFSDRNSLAANPTPMNRSTDIPRIEGRKLSQLETTTVRLPSKTAARPASPPSAPSQPRPQSPPPVVARVQPPPMAAPPQPKPAATPPQPKPVVARTQTPASVAPPKSAEGITAPDLVRRQSQQSQSTPSPAQTAAPATPVTPATASSPAMTPPSNTAQSNSAPASPARPPLQFAESSFGLRTAPSDAPPTQREIPTMASSTDGGVSRRGPTALNVVGMPQGAYSKKMFAEIGRYWTQLLDRRYADGQPGRARLNFTLYPTGHVAHLKIAHNTASPILAELCETAVLQCAPFDPWPEDLKLIGGDHLDISIDFNVYLYDR